ncbi:hypothetical protein ACP3PM_20915 [Pseudomonas iridis]
MKIVDAVTSVELHWYNRRWNMRLRGDQKVRDEIQEGLVYDRFGRLYLAQVEGLVDYCSAGSGGACGGTFKMRDGSVEEVVGAWSSNPGDVFTNAGVDTVSTSFNGLVISISVDALRELAHRFNFVINETTDAYRYNVSPVPQAEKVTLERRYFN